MIVRDLKRVFIFLVPTIVLLYLGFSLYHGSFAPTELLEQALSRPPPSPPDSSSPKKDGDGDGTYHFAPTPRTHNELSSLATPSRSYFLISFGPGQEGAINPNIIPHPTLDNTYAIVAQEVARGGFDFHEIACYAAFSANNTLLSCTEPPRNLPIEPTKGGPCEGQYKLLELNAGPHDARVFWGPDGVYAVYGSNSRFGCFGQFIQNFAGLMDWTAEMVAPSKMEAFKTGTEIDRPGKRGEIEKNWFVFWDREGGMYAHYDVLPRSFAKLEGNGSVVGPDLAAVVGEKDEKCLARLMPRVEGGDGESIHQATNSLAVTLCRRRDPECVAGRENTVVFAVFHHKTFRDWHSVYEPYALAFRQEAPFEVYGVGRKPLWIRGRGVRGDGVTEMMFVTSMAWKGKGQRYHGYLDDEMFLGFGIEDKGTGGIDVRAEDVLADLLLCET
ncbi:hypothetical protein NKR19_g7888 [Coniochaeta hoffmannii]|uniref:Uncharacterized protein n=1 Tax=Coniochaeta hoffmannii TaxID=91930 RepID=A0AA38R7M1_9PEZI|nr:hypothetical protein NKR19_g7888 [Coniochaeta hoffmannii]